MLLFENIALALAGIKSNKTRSVLTMLGIIIGIAAVIAIMTIGGSMSQGIQEEMSSFGANQIMMYVTEREDEDDFGGPGPGMRFEDFGREMKDDDLITGEMIQGIRDNFGDRIEGIGLKEEIGEAKAKSGSLYANVRVVGLNADILKMEEIEPVAGRAFTKEDYREGRKVAMVTDYFVDNMFSGDKDAALGKQISVLVQDRYYSYTVVGVYEYDDSDFGYSTGKKSDIRTDLYIPIKTAREQNHNNKGFANITVVGDPAGDISTLSDELSHFMEDNYYSRNQYFTVDTWTMSSMVDELTKSMATVSLAVSLIAGISLLVGGIGVMNIMLVSITERTKEIGTRKALGATNGSIRTQFIVESIVLCLVGGIIGMILGCAAGLAGSQAMGYTGHIQPLSLAVSFGFSSVIGIFFGYYPANKAAKMNPIDALRYE